jgi:hypothetical protein
METASRWQSGSREIIAIAFTRNSIRATEALCQMATFNVVAAFEWLIWLLNLAVIVTLIVLLIYEIMFLIEIKHILRDFSNKKDSR